MPLHDPNAIDDTTAEHLLASLALPLHAPGQAAWTPELAEALSVAFGINPDEVETASKADLARAAIRVAARPAREEAAPAPMPESFGLITATAAITAALLVLKTHVLFEKDKDGKIYAKIETDSLPIEVIKGLVVALMGFAPRP